MNKTKIVTMSTMPLLIIFNCDRQIIYQNQQSLDIDIDYRELVKPYMEQKFPVIEFPHIFHKTHMLAEQAQDFKWQVDKQEGEQYILLGMLVEPMGADSAVYQKVIDSVPLPVFWKDKNSRIIGCNKLFAEHAGYSDVKYVIGKTDRELPWRQFAEKYMNDDKYVLDNKKPISYEEENVQGDGDTRQVFVKKMPMINEQGEANGVIGTFLDITHIKQVEEQLRVEKEKAEQALEVKNHFILNMEHDIRTPLSGLYGLANVLWEQEEAEEKKELLAHIANSGKELLDYCNSILDFSRIENALLPIVDKKFDLQAMLNRIMTIEQPAAIQKSLEFYLQHDENLPKVIISDEHRLFRILMNLVGNAIKFTPSGDVILITKLAKSINHHQAILKFTVEDTGVGIPAEKQLYIFEKFTRLTESNRNQYKGLGLGLRIVREYVNDLNGEIDVATKPTGGTIFTCTFLVKLPLLD